MNRRVATARVVLASFFAVVAVAAPGTPSGADDAGTFSANAASSGIRVSVTAPGYAAVQELVDFGFPVAQTTIDSLGESSGFASYPYPGSTFLAGPGTMAGLLGQGLPSFLTYPFIVSSSSPGQPEGKAARPGYELASKSTDTSSEATANAGASDQGSSFGFSSATARATRNPADRTVVADATNRAEAVTLAGVLKIGVASGAAKVTRPSGGQLTRESSFSLEGLSVGGQTVGLGPAGFTVPGTTVPAPGADALTRSLAQAGISVRYLQGSEFADGVISPGLAVTWKQQIPNGPLMVMTLTFGQALARASSDAAGAIGSDAPAPFDDTGTATTPSDVAAPVASGPVAPAAAVSTPYASGLSPVAVTAGPSSPAEVPLAAGPTSAGAGTAAPTAVLAPAARARSIRLEPTVNTFYSVLLFAALMAVVATMALRRTEN